MKYYSQDGQDKFLVEELFRDKKNGFYVDIGANDGVSLSNTKILEDIGWDGVCVEPLPQSFNKLINNRNCLKYNLAISEVNGNLQFLEIDGYSEMLSGLYETYDPRHLERINRELNLYGGTKKIIDVESKRFSDLIDRDNIDYVSIDVEGSELNVIKSINFDKHNIFCISVENNYGNNDVENYLKNFGFKFFTNIGADNFFIKNN